MQVQVVDYQRHDAPEAFTRSLRETGFAVIVNHPLRWELVEEVFAEWSAFFSSDAKYDYSPEPGSQAGYFGPDISEIAKGETVRDIKEFFHLYDDSVYPDSVSDAALRYRSQATDLAATLLGWVEANTPPDIAERYSQPLASMIDRSTRTLLRILRYPPLTGDEPPGAMRAAAHEDINLLTVLPSSNEPGLELLDINGEWHAVPCDPESLCINAGEMLEHASLGYFPATTHRVVNPTGAAAKRERMAAPLFLHPGDDVILRDDRPAFSFLQERLRELRGETLDQRPR